MREKIGFTSILGVMILFCVVGLYWMYKNGIHAGEEYLWLLVVGFVMLMVAVFAKYVAKLDFWFEFPFNKTPERGIMVFVLGFLLMSTFLTVAYFLGSQNMSKTIVPLTSLSSEEGMQSFAALQATNSAFWYYFVSSDVAPVIEELVLGFFFVTISSLAGYTLRTLWKLELSDTAAMWWDFVCAMIFSVVLFGVLHYFNDSYVNPDGTWRYDLLFFAMGFRLVLNVFIYKLGALGILFGIGAHKANNIIVAGWEVFKEAIWSFPGGLIEMVFMLSILFFAFMSAKKIFREWSLLEKDFPGG